MPVSHNDYILATICSTGSGPGMLMAINSSRRFEKNSFSCLFSLGPAQFCARALQILAMV